MPSELSVISEKICSKDRASHSDEHINDVFMRSSVGRHRYSKENRISDSELVGAVIWTAENYSDENMKKLMQLWSERRSLGALKQIYSEWQELYDSEHINDVCLRISESENEESNWLLLWKRLMRCAEPECAAAGFAADYCHEKNIDFNTWQNMFRLNGGRLGSIICGLFFCFCYSSDFVCTDEELLLCIDKMSDIHCELLLRNLLTCFPDEDTAYILNERYALSYRKIKERIPLNWCVKRSMEYSEFNGEI